MSEKVEGRVWCDEWKESGGKRMNFGLGGGERGAEKIPVNLGNIFIVLLETVLLLYYFCF